MTAPRSLLSLLCPSAARAPALRLSYSSVGASRRLLQTTTHQTTIPTEPPMPRNAGVHSSLTNPQNESSPQTTSPPPPPPTPASTRRSQQPSSSSSSSSSTSTFASTATATTTTTATAAQKPVPTRTKFRPRKAAMTLSAPAVEQLHRLMDQPAPKLIRIGVKNRGCSGLAYHLEYVDRPGKFDEEVVQDGVRVLIDSKALFSIIGSEMDWVEDKLSARFVFKNPNIKEQCGCGESFSVG